SERPRRVRRSQRASVHRGVDFPTFGRGREQQQAGDAREYLPQLRRAGGTDPDRGMPLLQGRGHERQVRLGGLAHRAGGRSRLSAAAPADAWRAACCPSPNATEVTARAIQAPKRLIVLPLEAWPSRLLSIMVGVAGGDVMKSALVACCVVV